MGHVCMGVFSGILLDKEVQQVIFDDTCHAPEEKPKDPGDPGGPGGCSPQVCPPGPKLLDGIKSLVRANNCQ